MENSQLAGILGLNEEDLKDGFQAGIAPEQLALMQRQAAMAEGLRDAPIAQGRDNGRVFTAANPLEHIATMYSRYKGNKLADAKYADMERRLQELAMQRQRAAIGALRGMNSPGLGGGVPGGGRPEFDRLYGPPQGGVGA